MYSSRTSGEFSWWGDTTNRTNYSNEGYIRSIDGSFGIYVDIHYAPIAGSRRFSRVSVSRVINQQFEISTARFRQLWKYVYLRVPSWRCNIHRYLLLDGTQRFYYADFPWTGAKSFVHRRMGSIKWQRPYVAEGWHTMG